MTNHPAGAVAADDTSAMPDGAMAAAMERDFDDDTDIEEDLILQMLSSIIVIAEEDPYEVTVKGECEAAPATPSILVAIATAGPPPSTASLPSAPPPAAVQPASVPTQVLPAGAGPNPGEHEVKHELEANDDEFDEETDGKNTAAAYARFVRRVTGKRATAPPEVMCINHTHRTHTWTELKTRRKAGTRHTSIQFTYAQRHT